MNNDIELLTHVYENAEMGYTTTNDLLNALEGKDNKIKPLLLIEIKEYEKHMGMCKKILKDSLTTKSNGIAKISSKIGIGLETIKDNSDSAMAQMIVKGMTMGIVELNSDIDKFKTICSKKSIKITKNYLEFLETEIERLKEYM